MKATIFYVENNNAKVIRVAEEKKHDMIDQLLAEGCVITKVATEISNNYCSAVVVFKNDAREERRVSVASLEQAMYYVKEVVIPNNWEFIAIERGFDY